MQREGKGDSRLFVCFSPDVNVPDFSRVPSERVRRIAYLEGFAALPSLRELDLSHNGVQGMLGLVSNTDLRVLRISHNCIRCVEGLHQMKRLQEVRRVFDGETPELQAGLRAASRSTVFSRLNTR